MFFKKVNNHSDSLSSETWNHHADVVLSVKVSPHDGSSVLSVSADRTVALWNSNAHHKMYPPSKTYNLLGADYWTAVESWWGATPGNQEIYVAGIVWDGSVEIWDVTREKRILSIPKEDLGGAVSLGVSPNGMLIAVGTSNGWVHLWEIFHGKRVNVLKPNSHERTTCNNFADVAATSVQWSPDGSHLAAGLQTGVIIVWRGIDKKPSSWKQYALLQGHTKSVQCLQWSADQTQLASGSMDTMVRVWSMQMDKSECVAVLRGHSAHVSSLQWQEEWLATGSWDTLVKVWHVPSQSCLQTLQGHKDGVYSVAWHQSHDGLVSGSLDRNVHYWKGMGKLLHTTAAA